MSWVDLLWSMVSAVFLTLAVIQGLTWLRARDAWENLLFALAAAAAAVLAVLELKLVHASSPALYGEILRWMHVAAGVLMVAVAWFIHRYLGGRRTWLAWSVTALRVAILIPNFLVYPNATFSEITQLNQIQFLGETFSVPVGQENPWRVLTQLSVVLFLWLTIDASRLAWKRGLRRRALVIGGATLLAVVMSAVCSRLMLAGMLPAPLISFSFLILVVAMAYELSGDLVRTARLSNELRVSQERMRLAASAANLGLWEWDVVKDDIWATEAGLARVGATESERVTLDRFLQTVHPDDREHTRQAVHSALEHGDDFQMEYRVTQPNRETECFSAHGHVERGPNGKPLRVRGVTIDITERKQTEAELEQRRMELMHMQRLSAMGQLSSVVAHELNQPLGAILRNAEAGELLLKQEPPDLAEVQAILADIQQDNRRAAAVIEHMRSLLKRRHPELEALSLNDLIHQVVVLLRSEIQTHQVAVQVEVAQGLPRVLGDRVHLQQVIVNLLLNSFDALGDHPNDRRQVIIRASESDEGMVELSVIDQGTGIAPDKLPHIFEPFVTTKSKGIGIGLAISKAIVELQGGKIFAENNPDGGATFRFTLKAVPSEGTT